MPEALVTVETFLWLAEADEATSVLRTCGIECHLADQYFLLWFPLHALAIGGVKLQVKEMDASDAREILRWAYTKEEVQCPNCGSRDVVAQTWYGWMIFALLLGVPFVLMGALAVLCGCALIGIRLRRLGIRWRCEGCGLRWKLDDAQPREDASETDADRTTDL